MQLSKRLQAVSQMVTSGSRLADVGTDHGYIPLSLVMEGRVPGAIAMDINQGPLLRAQENIARYGLEDKIQTRLSDGVNALDEGEADSVVVAGMGGWLVIHILTEGRKALKTVQELILQPQSDLEQVRRFLQMEEYQIHEEDMVLEDGKFYPIMRVVHGYMEELTDIEYKYGPRLLAMRHPCLKKYLECKEAAYENVCKTLQKSGSENSGQRLLEIEKELEQVRRAKEEFR